MNSKFWFITQAIHKTSDKKVEKGFKKALLLLGCMVLLGFSLFAQQNHFIYVQTENKQPFYIRLDKTIFSSTASGYLIIPKLQDGSFSLTIGFPKNEWPEQKVTCSLNNKDAGYILKNFGDKGWGLFNLQTMEVLMSEIKSDNVQNSTADTKDIFSNTLSNVVNDPSIIKRLENKAPVKEEIKVVAETDKKDTGVNEVVKKDEPVKPIAETEKKEEPKKAEVQITRLMSASGTEGTEMVYTDVVNGRADTIRILIPEENNAVTNETEKKTDPVLGQLPKKDEQRTEDSKKDVVLPDAEKHDVPKNEPVNKEEPQKESIKMELPKSDSLNVRETKKELIADTVAANELAKQPGTNKEATKNKEPKFIDIDLPNPNSKKDTMVKSQVVPVGAEEKKVLVTQVPEKPKDNSSKLVIANSDCKNFASDDDFLKLRKKMAAEEKEEDMLDISKKAFRSKCFTTEQVKNLSVLFLKDEGKYKFFDMAYPFVSDSYNFGTLESQMSDNYFIARFKAMIRH